MSTTKLLILDVDGVMTNGSKIYGLDGCIAYKRFKDRDFTAIKRFQEEGVDVCWLSADSKVNEKLAGKRKIDFYLARTPEGKIDKTSFIQEFVEIYDVEVSNMVYVGDDYHDLPMMRALLAHGGKAFCPADAALDVRNVAKVLLTNGGEGVVAELFERYKAGIFL